MARVEREQRSPQINQKIKATFFVGTDGNDNWSGKLSTPNAKRTDGPFATLVQARDAVREIKKKHGLKGPVTVMVRGGKYYLDETVVLSAADSGIQDCPITYMAYPGEKPIISGGKAISDWEPYKGKILQALLLGAKGGKCKFRQLFFNSERQIRARYPNLDSKNPLYGGWAFMEGPADEGSTSALKFKTGYAFFDKSGDRATAFKYKPGTFKSHWAKPTEGEVNVFPGAGWGNNIIPIKAIDEEKRTIVLQREVWQFNRPPWYIAVSFCPNNRFYVENILEELDQPGEWCLDSEDGMLYFWPPRDTIGPTDEVVVPILDCLIDLHGVSWITISGFTFTETTDGDDYHHEGVEGYGAMFPRRDWKYCGDAVHLKETEHCCIENNIFYAVGGNAIYLEGYNTRNIIQDNEINRAGSNGICLLGSRERHPMFNQVLDNHIHHCGVIIKYVAGVFLGLSEGNVIGHNLIEHMPHHAINLGNSGFGRNIIEYNEIRFACLEIYDTGAINCWMEDPNSSLQRDAERSGHIIRYNLISDTCGCRIDEKGKLIAPAKDSTFGIYLDNASSNCFVYGNIIIRAGFGINVQNGKNNIIENNIFVDCKWQLRYSDYVSSWAPQMAGFMTSNRFCRNIFYCAHSDGYLFLLHGWTDKVVEQSDYNLFFNAAGGEYLLDDYTTEPGRKTVSFSQWQKWGYDRHSVIANPLFVDTEHDNYQLRAKSPAFKIGFIPIDIANIGLRKKQ